MAFTLPETLDELRDLINEANAAYQAIQQAQAQEHEATKATIGAAIASLDTLLGPVGAPAGTGSIRAVLAYGDATIAQNPGQAVALVVHGMETLTATVLDIARVVSTQD